MYVCLCHGITDKQIRQAVKGGCGNLCDLRCKTSVGSDCGRCSKIAKQIIKQEIEQEQTVIATFDV
ncbi:(2Fe-2S)-binding protein [Saccharobesus litoralis]|uniref:Bacterioferritin-associated ferredoxin n=1 Tax=Saccharobesus litoralis TaxID=2172099 RepID=A0A2S0VTK0_9ALTE|nr:(2Fe-2S)-binding protein [Saccharobesus litoralis]AWB67546.1 (2Fe-2S)-binding protein [Saccharobesus litoralis]